MEAEGNLIQTVTQEERQEKDHLDMYISDCLAYENIEVKVEVVEEHINLYVRSIKNGYWVSLTLSGTQVATITNALIDTVAALGEIEDKLGIFGSASRIGTKPEIVKQKGAA